MIYNPTYEPNRFLSKVLSWRLRALLIGIDSSIFYENNAPSTYFSAQNVANTNSFPKIYEEEYSSRYSSSTISRNLIFFYSSL